jgi:glycosyltransferase involved in cell wall biosynthesis
MKLLIDLIATQENPKYKFDGGREYSKVIFKEIIEHKVKSCDITCFCDTNKAIDEDILEIIEKYNLNVIKLDNISQIQNILKSDRYDKVYSGLPYVYSDLNLGDVEFVMTLHGLRPLEMPTDLYEIKFASSTTEKAKFIYKNIFSSKYAKHQKEVFYKLLNVSTKVRIVTDSYHTKYSIVENFPMVKPESVYVLYCPVPPTNTCLNEKEYNSLNIVSKEFFLLISADRWIKNPYRAVKAFDEVVTNWPNINKKMVVLGAKNPKLFDIKNPKSFMFLDYVSRDTLDLLYKNAYAFIYPTLNEGFGYPPLESMRHGTPVLASAITSVSEVCGDGAIYFNPFSIDEIKNRILQLTFERERYEYITSKCSGSFQAIIKKQTEMLQGFFEIL